MKVRILGVSLVSVAVLGLALAALLRPDARPRDGAAPPAVDSPAAVQSQAKPDWSAHPLSSFRVFENETPEGLDVRGVGYTAQVTSSGLDFKAKDFGVAMRAARVEQGGRSVELGRGPADHPAFAHARIDRSFMTEEYLFENTRAEQFFRIPSPIGSGALRVLIDVQMSPGGSVTDEGRSEWRETPFWKGGLAFRDAAGDVKMAYHGAVAIDASGKRCPLSPRYEDGQIALEVPASFVSGAAWPVVVDPWLELNLSSTYGGISNSGNVSQNVAMATEGGGNPYVVWADDTSGNFEIYLRYWNGFNWRTLGGADSGGGISGTAGESTKPCIALDTSNAQIYVAWQDDTSGNFEIYCKKWDGAGWVALGESASGGGVSNNLGESWFPSIAITKVNIPGTIVTKGSAPPGDTATVPIIAWQDTSSGLYDIYAAYYYPGDPGAFDIYGGVLSPVIPAGWYGLDGSNSGGGISNTSLGVSERPVIRLDSQGRAIVAWHDSMDLTSGNYDILVSRNIRTTPYNPYRSDTLFAGLPPYPGPVPGRTSPVGDEWGGIVAPTSVWDNVSGTAGDISQFPSLALDTSDNPWVAWEEILTGPGPTFAKNFEVYLRHFNGAAWVGIGGSDTPDVTVPASPVGGISRTSGKSASPSIAIGSANRPTVVWQDDTSGNPEIYVRQYNLATNSWDQVGIGGSAKAIGAETPDVPGGISKTSGLSFNPVVQVDGFGNPVVAWADGAAGTWDIFLKRFYSNAPARIRQTFTDGTILLTGASTDEPTVLLRCYPETEILTPGLPGNFVRMQVEVKPIDSPFVGSPTLESPSVNATLNVNGSALDDVETVIAFSGLPNVEYHWRVRTIDDVGRASAWISYGFNFDGQKDFAVLAPPEPPPGGTPPPTNLLATSGNAVVDLYWTPPTGVSGAFYNVYRATTTGGPYTEITTGGITGTAFTDANVTNGTTYYYVVTAQIQTSESIYSNEAAGRPLAPPTNLIASGSDRVVNLSWTAAPGATSYIVKRSTSQGSGYVAFPTPTATNSFSDTTVTNGTTYYYVVSALFGTDQSVNSNEAWATPMPIANTLTAMGSDGQVNLSWAVAPGLTGYTYNVKRSTTSGSGYATITNVANAAYTDTGVTNGVTYYYVVTMVMGTIEGANSNEAFATPIAPPEGLTAVGANGQVTLNWLAATGATGYNVKRSTTAGSGYTLLASVGTTLFTDTAVTNGTTYYYVVSTQAGTTESVNSNEAWATPMNAPTGLTATGGNGQIGLTWTAVAGATSYNIKRSTTSGSGYLTIATVTVTNYTDLAVTVGTTYYYVVSALIGTSQSANSNEASATPLSPPTGVSATPGDRAITLAWAAMSGATSYNVKRATVSGGPYTTIASVTGTTFTDTGLTAGVTYYYVVSAMMGVVESVNSSEVSTTPSLGVEDDDKCGLLGIEILGLLGLLRLFRRRR